MARSHLTKQWHPRGGGISGFFIGLSYPLRALRLFQHYPSLRPYVLIPLGINIVLGIGLYFFGMRWGGVWVEEQMVALTNWVEPVWLDTAIALLSPAIQWLLVVLMFIVLGFVLLQFGGILGSPFYGQLSEKIEILQAGKLDTPHPVGLGLVFVEIWRAIAFELKKLILLAVIGIPLLLFHFLPGIGSLIATNGWLALAALLVCLDMMDAPLERRRLRFRQKLGLVFRTLPASAGFAFICLVLVSIPLMNLLAIPLCVSAGTLFFCDRILPKSPLPP
jgi:CysZ protein